MALQLDLATSGVGLPIKKAYARVNMMRGDKDVFLVHVVYYANADARQNNATLVQEKSFFAPASDLTSGTNPLEMAYEWLKTQPDFAGAIDC